MKVIFRRVLKHLIFHFGSLWKALKPTVSLCQQKCKRSGTLESNYCSSNFGKIIFLLPTPKKVTLGCMFTGEVGAFICKLPLVHKEILSAYTTVPLALNSYDLVSYLDCEFFVRSVFHSKHK